MQKKSIKECENSACDCWKNNIRNSAIFPVSKFLEMLEKDDKFALD